MRRGLRDAFAVVLPHWPLIFAVGLGRVMGSSGLWREFLFLDLIFMISLMILVCGRIVADLVPEFPRGTWAIIKENLLNYLLAVVIVGAPKAVLGFLAAGQIHSRAGYVVLGITLSSLFGVLTIYALPIVFLKRSSLAAIVAGVVFLTKNLAASGWIAGIVVITNLLVGTGALVFRAEMTPGSLVLVITTSFVGAFLNFLTFAAASRILLGGIEAVAGPD